MNNISILNELFSRIFAAHLLEADQVFTQYMQKYYHWHKEPVIIFKTAAALITVRIALTIAGSSGRLQRRRSNAITTYLSARSGSRVTDGPSASSYSGCTFNRTGCVARGFSDHYWLMWIADDVTTQGRRPAELCGDDGNGSDLNQQCDDDAWKLCVVSAESDTTRRMYQAPFSLVSFRRSRVQNAAPLVRRAKRQSPSIYRLRQNPLRQNLLFCALATRRILFRYGGSKTSTYTNAQTLNKDRKTREKRKKSKVQHCKQNTVDQNKARQLRSCNYNCELKTSLVVCAYQTHLHCVRKKLTPLTSYNKNVKFKRI